MSSHAMVQENPTITSGDVNATSILSNWINVTYTSHNWTDISNTANSVGYDSSTARYNDPLLEYNDTSARYRVSTLNGNTSEIYFDSTLYANTSARDHDANWSEWESSVVVSPKQANQIEPLPEWSSAIPIWGQWGWGFHTLGFGAFFILLDIFLIITLVRLRRRMCSQPLLVLVTGILFVMAGLRALFLLVDPYSSTGHLPFCVIRITYNLAFPCLTSAFCCIQILLLRITRVKGPPPTCSHYQTVMVVMIGHFCMVILIELIVCGNPTLKLLILITQAFFITWGLVLCFGFIYNGFKLSQFTSETKRALEQLVAYSKVRREILRDGNRRDLALHRMSKPKIRSEEEERQALSDMALEDSNSSDLAGSSESLSFFNEAHLVFDEQAIEQAYNAAFPRLKRPLCCDKENNNYNNQIKLHLTATTSNYDISSESDYVTDTPVVTPQQPFSLDTNTTQVSSNEHHTYYNPGYTELKSMKSSNSFVFRNKSFPQSSSNGYIQVNGNSHHIDDNTLMEPELKPESSHYEESGYTADTEFYSPLPKKKSKTKDTNKHKFKESHKQDVKETSNSIPPGSPSHDQASSPTRQPYALPDNKGALGLYRIRQGQVLRRVLHVTYGSALLGFIACVLHLYAMFGVYGVLSNEEVAEPWSWYCFQTASR